MPPPVFYISVRLELHLRITAFHYCIKGFCMFGVCPRLNKNVSDDRNAVMISFSITMNQNQGCVEVESWTARTCHVARSTSWPYSFEELFPFRQTQHGHLAFDCSNQVPFLCINAFLIHSLSSRHQSCMIFSYAHGLFQQSLNAFFQVTYVIQRYHTTRSASYHCPSTLYTLHVLPFRYVASVGLYNWNALW